MLRKRLVIFATLIVFMFNFIALPREVCATNYSYDIKPYRTGSGEEIFSYYVGQYFKGNYYKDTLVIGGREAYFDLHNAYDTFVFNTGCRDNCEYGGALQVYGDGKLLKSIMQQKPTDDLLTIEINVEGINVLKISSTESYASIFNLKAFSNDYFDRKPPQGIQASTQNGNIDYSKKFMGLQYKETYNISNSSVTFDSCGQFSSISFMTGIPDDRTFNGAINVFGDDKLLLHIPEASIHDGLKVFNVFTNNANKIRIVGTNSNTYVIQPRLGNSTDAQGYISPRTIIDSYYYKAPSIQYDSFYGSYGNDTSVKPLDISKVFFDDSYSNYYVSLPKYSYITFEFDSVNCPVSYIMIDTVGISNESADIYVKSKNSSFVYLTTLTEDKEQHLITLTPELSDIDTVKIVGRDLGGGAPGFDLCSVYLLVSKASNLGTSSSAIKSKTPVYSTEQQEVLDSLKVDTDELLQNISCGNHPIKGPSVTFLGKTFYLFEFDGKLNFKFKNLNVQAKVDADNKTIQFLVGYKIFSESADLGNDYNNSSYWSQSYQQVKSLYKGVTGKNVDTTKLWNQFSSLRGQLKEFDSDLLVDAKCKVAGFLELSYETGSAKFSEGGFLMEASIGGEFVGRVPAFPPAYVVLGLEASLEGKIFVAYEQYISINSELNAALAANVGVGLGSKKAKTYLEGGLTGELGAKMLAVSGSFKDYTTDFDPLTVTIKGEIYLKGSFLGFLNGEKNWPIGEPVQLYPKNDISLMSYALFDEDTIDDVIANSTPLSRDYLYDVMLMSIDDSDKLYSDKSIYSYNAPVLTTLSDGSMLLLWVDDLGTKNDINKTSLMYSIYNGEVWSEASELFETGTYNGAPTIYNDGENVHIIWSKAKTVFADAAGLEDLITDTELNYTSYANGEFTEPVVLTENSLFEINYDIIENNGKMAVAWSENNENDPYMTSGTNSLYVREYNDGSWSEKELVSQSDNAIDEIELYYVDDAVNCAYTLLDADNSTSVYNNSDMLSDGGYLNYYNGVLYYLSDSKIMAYDAVGDTLLETGLDGVNNFSIYEGNAYSLVSDGFACELYESICINGVFSDWEQVTEFDKYIRDYSVTTDSVGEPVYALNLVDVNEGKSIYGASELAVCKASAVNALEVAAVYYNETNVSPSHLLPLNIDINNVGTTDINNLNVSITDNKGTVLSSGVVNTKIASGESATIVYDYILPSELELYDITVTVTSSEDERNLDNNSIGTSIGYPDIIVQDVIVERTENGAVASGSIYNAGYSNATNVVLSIYDASYPDEVLATIECADIASCEAYDFTYDIPEKYLTLEDKMTMYGLNFEAGSDSAELNYANNTEKVVFGELTDYTVAFVDGNQLLDIISVEEFESYSVDKEGYTLEGWYTSSSLDADSKITTIPTDISENLIVFAKWIPMSIDKAEYANNSISVKATVSEELLSESGIIVLAIYQNEKLAAMNSMDITSNIDYSFDNISEADNYNVKMFCWSGLGNLKPLCGAICADVK